MTKIEELRKLAKRMDNASDQYTQGYVGVPPDELLALLDLVELQFRANHWAQQELIMWDHAEGGADFQYLDSPCVEALTAYEQFNKGATT